MKYVRFANSATAGPCAHYVRAAAYGAGADDAGLCAILRENAYPWLDDLARSHAAFGRRAAAGTPEWWYSRLSRLDARPWGNAGVIKPLFFARAVLAWFDKYPNAEGLTLIGAPSSVGKYLQCSSRAEDIGIEIDRDMAKAVNPTRYDMSLTWHVLRLIRSHLFRRKPELGDKKSLFLFHPPQGSAIDDGFRFYFTAVLDGLPDDMFGAAAFGVQGRHRKQGRIPSLLDAIRAVDIVGALRKIRIYKRAMKSVANADVPCEIGGVGFTEFWHDYVTELADSCEVLEAVCARACLERVGAHEKRRTMVYPYEEKAVERALLDAANVLGWPAVGFTPHPQHRLNIAMQDRTDVTWPKPATYAFCGDGYEQFFRGWGNKANAATAVWGSAKALAPMFEPQFDSRGRKIRMLFAASHPCETDMLSAWLEACPGLAEYATIQIRRYRATGAATFDSPMAKLLKRYPEIDEVDGVLDENLQECDVVLFCATSAGLEAINRGRLAIFADLNDVFPITPSFDDVTALLPCNNGDELLMRLKALAAMNPDQQRDVYEQQCAVAGRCFAPIDQNIVMRTIA